MICSTFWLPNTALGYRAYILGKNRLVPLDVYAEGQIPPQNYYFLPPQREDRFESFIRSGFERIPV